MKNSGFTLMELMCVVVIVGILAALAIPSYQSYVLRSYNVEAFNALSSYALQMQQFFQDSGNYGTSSCGVSPPTTPHFNYQCALAGSGFIIQASSNGVGGLTTNAYVFWINDSNVQTTTAYPNTTVSTAAPAPCWLNSSGGC